MKCRVEGRVYVCMNRRNDGDSLLLSIDSKTTYSVRGDRSHKSPRPRISAIVPTRDFKLAPFVIPPSRGTLTSSWNHI